MEAGRATKASRAALCCLLAALAISFGAAPARAERTWHVTLYGAKWVHENLGTIAWRGTRRELEWWDQYFAGAGISRVLLKDFDFPIPVLGAGAIEIEGTFAQHFGEMSYPELTAALLWRTPDLALPGPFSVNAAVGKGLSYTFREPALESVRTDRESQKLMTYLAFEFELSHAARPNLHLVPRLHHRSGMYGLIGPRGDGSNYIGLGLRLSIP